MHTAKVSLCLGCLVALVAVASCIPTLPNTQQLQLVEADADAVPVASFKAALDKGETSDTPFVPEAPLPTTNDQEDSMLASMLKQSQLAEAGSQKKECDDVGLDQVSAADEDAKPDPGCTKATNCADCLSNRKCGWCAVERLCMEPKNPNPDCVHNPNISICPPPCASMFHVNWPEGHKAVLPKYCDLIQADYTARPPKRLIHFSE